ncbi:MAG: response regulator [Burkholderiales bacterium]|nr:MAG: response regulator [Burkholderiales bacterium]
MRVLVVEDDPGIGGGIMAALRNAGHAADLFTTLSAAWTALNVESFDVMLLDLGLPDGDGLELLTRLRRQPAPAPEATTGAQPDMPVLIMTARDGVSDRIAGLDSGADDYIVKPFDADEMLARLRAMTRRAAGRSRPEIEYGALRIDPAARQVLRDGQPVALGAKEFALLMALMQERPRVMSKARLESALYGFGDALESNAIEVHVHHLRRKLGDGLIRTVRGVGYFIPEEPA